MPSTSTLSAYLAKNYLTADQPTKKTKKRKRHPETNTISIADDSEETWNNLPTKPTPASEEDEENTPSSTTLHSKSADFRRKKTSQWQTLTGAPATLLSAKDSADAEAENAARVAAEEDEADGGPVVVDEAMKMSNGAHAGLQSAADMAAQIASHRRREEETAASGGGMGWARKSIVMRRYG